MRGVVWTIVQEFTPDGSLVARFEPGENPVVQYYYFDGLGSTVLMTEGLEIVADRYDYDAWGNEYPIEASTSDNPYRYVGQLGYYTHWMDSSLSDLLHLGVRFYEPSAGRFGQLDSVGEGLNWFVYAGDNPASYADPAGLAKWLRCDMGRRPWFLGYYHSWLEFEKITCKGSKAYGFWPAGIRKNDPYSGKKSTRQEPVVVVDSDDREVFERFLCDCIKESLASPPQFKDPRKGEGFYVCGSWAKDMWRCAEDKMQPYLLAQGCRTEVPGVMPKTPPGGD